MDLWTTINFQLRCCSAQPLECLRNAIHLAHHYNSSASISSTVILQLFLDTEVNFHQKAFIFISLLNGLGTKFPKIEKLTLNECTDANSIPVINNILPLFPNLKVFQGTIENKVYLKYFNLHSPNLVQLSLYMHHNELECNDLSKLFFGFKTLSEIQISYMKLEEVIISFPNLKVFSLPYICFQHYDFFKMFLHFYPKIELILATHSYQVPPETPISWYDSVLSHTVTINPNLELKNCELVLQDLLSPACVETLRIWSHLESLTLSISFHSKDKIPFKLIGKNLEAILRNNSNIHKLNMRILTPVREEEVEQFLYPSLQCYGSRIKFVKIWEKGNLLTHKTLVLILNMCRNMSHLCLISKPTSKCCKEIKLCALDHLEVFKSGWVKSNATSKSQVAANLICDILKNSCSLKSFTCLIDQVILDAICQIQFGKYLVALNFYFPIPIVDPYWIEIIKDLLISLPNLSDFVTGVESNRNLHILLSKITERCRNSGINFKEIDLQENEIESFLL